MATGDSGRWLRRNAKQPAENQRVARSWVAERILRKPPRDIDMSMSHTSGPDELIMHAKVRPSRMGRSAAFPGLYQRYTSGCDKAH